jgi:hypothetical protein
MISSCNYVVNPKEDIASRWQIETFNKSVDSGRRQGKKEVVRSVPSIAGNHVQIVNGDDGK